MSIRILMKTWAIGLGGLALVAAAPLAQAVTVTDLAGDFVPSYTGVKGGDLDVISSFVTYNPSTDLFVFSGTMNANIGTTPNVSYVWGVNRGNGAATFSSIGLTQVLFDTVVRFNADGSGTAGGVTLTAGTVKISGTTISGEISGALLPSNGFDKSAYTWNLWPRNNGVAGIAAISDFAPNNVNAAVTAVPEPASVAMLALGLGVIGLVSRRRLQSGR